MRITAVVPARDRADTVGHTVSALVSLPEVETVWVVDDGSADDTASVAAAAGARVIPLPVNVGKGGAVAAAVAATPNAEIYLLVDADVGTCAVNAGPLLDALRAGEADMAVGVLAAAGGKGGFGLVRDMAVQPTPPAHQQTEPMGLPPEA